MAKRNNNAKKILKEIKLKKYPNITTLTLPISAEKLYGRWLIKLDNIENFYMKSNLSVFLEDIALSLFPLLDVISYTLFNNNGRKYLEKIGCSRGEADIIMSIFRNGYIHNGTALSVEYRNGLVLWEVAVTNKPDGFHNYKTERILDYYEMGDGDFKARLQLDTLMAHIRHDLELRKIDDMGLTLNMIVGKRIDQNRRSIKRVK